MHIQEHGAHGRQAPCSLSLHAFGALPLAVACRVRSMPPAFCLAAADSLPPGCTALLRRWRT